MEGMTMDDDFGTTLIPAAVAPSTTTSPRVRALRGRLLARTLIAPSVSLDEQVLRLLLDDNHVAVVPLAALSPRLAAASFEDAHHFSWDTRYIDWDRLGVRLGVAVALSRAVAAGWARPRAWATLPGHGYGPGLDVAWGRWQLRLAWGQVAAWRDGGTHTYFALTNPYSRFGRDLRLAWATYDAQQPREQ